MHNTEIECLHACAQDIDRLCSDCASLIDNHEKIAVLSAVHYNLGKTLQVLPLVSTLRVSFLAKTCGY